MMRRWLNDRHSRREAAAPEPPKDRTYYWPVITASSGYAPGLKLPPGAVLISPDPYEWRSIEEMMGR